MECQRNTHKEFSIHEADSNTEQESGKDECSRSSVSSDDSISSLNPHGNSQFYYFYQGMTLRALPIFKIV